MDNDKITVVKEMPKDMEISGTIMPMMYNVSMNGAWAFTPEDFPPDVSDDTDDVYAEQ
jgi:hypothetical protein